MHAANDTVDGDVAAKNVVEPGSDLVPWSS